MVTENKNTTRKQIEVLISENKINPSNFQELSNSLNIPYKTIKWYYYKLREKTATDNTMQQIKSNVIIYPRLQINIKQIEATIRIVKNLDPPEKKSLIFIVKQLRQPLNN